MADDDTTPTPDLLRELLRYEPDTGKLFWRERPIEMFTAERHMNAWNARHKNKEAFTASNDRMYRVGDIFSKAFKAHRVIWAIHHGDWPDDQIDHINGVRDDNRIENLRVVTNAENARNKSMRKNNKSGVMGVYWNKCKSKWSAEIQCNGKKIHLGYFTSKDDAAAARAAADVKYSFHENHGRDAQ